MARKDDFVPEDVIELVPIVEGNQQYGLELCRLYDKSMHSVLGNMFISGVSGMICGEDSPKSIDFLHKILASKTYSRPEDQSENSVPAMSDGYHISTRLDFRFIFKSLRWYRSMRFQGDYAKLLGVDYPHEGTGTMAVCLAGNLALSGVMPKTKDDAVVIREVKIASMHADEEHQEPWLAVEFDVYVHNHSFSMRGLPRDLKTGYVSLEALEQLAKDDA